MIKKLWQSLNSPGPHTVDAPSSLSGIELIVGLVLIVSIPIAIQLIIMLV